MIPTEDRFGMTMKVKEVPDQETFNAIIERFFKCEK